MTDDAETVVKLSGAITFARDEIRALEFNLKDKKHRLAKLMKLLDEHIERARTVTP